MTNCLNCGYQSDAAFKFCPACGTEALAVNSGVDPFLGKILVNKYRVLDLVGAGAMGKVYRAEHTSLKKIIAIKVLHDDLMLNDESVQRFQGEGIAAGKFTHASAIQIFDFDKDDAGHWFLAMEFVEGSSLKDYLADKGAMGAGSAVDLIIQVLDAVGEAHRQGIIHRDLKPDNIMVLENASGELTVKVLDFGLSKLVDVAAGSAMLTQTGRILGTPRYMAPEQWGGVEVDHRIDIYATGLVLYELLTGEAPFASTTIQDAIVQSTKDPVPSLLDSDLDIQVPQGLDDVVQTALAKDREDRYATAEEMVEELLELDFDKIVRKRRSKATTRSRSVRRKPAASGSKVPMLWIGAAVVVAAVLVFVFSGSGATADYALVSLKPAAERSDDERSYVAALAEARGGLRQNEPDQALKVVDAACRMGCADAEAFRVRAAVYRAKNDDRAARLDLLEAVKRDAGYAAAVADLAWIEFDQADFAKAGSGFVAAAAADAGLASALVGKASLALHDGQRDAAAELLGKVDASVDSASLQTRMGALFLELGQVDQALLAFTQAKRSSNFDWRVHAGLGRAYMHQGDSKQARDAFAEAIKLNGKTLSVRVSLATLHVSKEQWPEALRVCEEGLVLQSDHKGLLVLQGIAMHSSGNPMGAIVALQKGAADDDLQAQMLLGILYQGQRRWTDAIACYTRLQALDGDTAAPFLNHGLCLLQQEDYETAGKQFKRAIEVDEDHAFAHLSYAVVAMEYLGDKAAALASFKRYQELGGADPRVPGWIAKLSQ